MEDEFHNPRDRARSILQKANIPDDIGYKLCKSEITTAKQLDGLVVTKHKGKEENCYEYWTVSVPNFASEKYTWGEAGSVNTKNIENSKMAACGTTCIFLDKIAKLDRMCIASGILEKQGPLHKGHHMAEANVLQATNWG